jgi:DNA-binding SARP family transcriptional activator
MEIRLNRDPEAALGVLARLQDRQAASEYRFIGEAADVWTGLALLALGEDEGALGRLERAVQTMAASDRILELPTAAVYLSEARWRAGDEDGADAAADLAYDAARRQGSNHYLLQALASFPAVVARRLDSEPRADSPWHELGRALHTQGVAAAPPRGVRVELVEFGTPALLVDGEPAPRPRIAKSYELLAFLLGRDGAAGRDELLSALFDGRSDDSARAYLRQAVHQLREVLPAEVRLVSEPTRTWIEDPAGVSGESARLEAALAEAARLQGEERIEATLRALTVADRGRYLEGLSSIWIEDRRDHLARLVADARQDAAELCFAAGRYADAARLVDAILREDPFREGAHRLEMRIANATGDEDRVIAAYRRCERRLGELGTTPSSTTRQLLETLRR